MHPNGSKGIVSNVIDLKYDLKKPNCHRKSSNNNFVLGGIFSNSELAWLYNGPLLKVIKVKNGRIQSSFDFTYITGDPKTEIISVIEYPVQDYSRVSTKEDYLYFVISYMSKQNVSTTSYISFCHPRTSKVMYTLTTVEKVTSVCLISGKRDHASPIGGVVKQMSGSLALGTQTGQILIVDTKEIFSYVRRNAYDPVRNRFGEIMILDMKRHSDNEIKDKIINTEDDCCHIAVALCDKKDSRDHASTICTLFYIQESTTLAVGFKNGVFQLWDVNSLKKLYKSPSLEVPTPVVRFGFQEPCNDPQNVCYLWVLYESENEKQACLPFAVMYGLHYKRMTTVSNYGRVYKNFIHCRKRFDVDVEFERCVGGKCISSSVVSNTPSNILRHANKCEEDPSKINLFVMIFETWERNADITSCISMVVFDMNQWYKAQMPHQCYLGYSTTPFINFTVLDRVSERKSSVLDIHIKKDSIQQFLTFNLSEEYSYPSSLSFDTIVLSDSKIIQLRVLGAQRNVLERIITEGPSGLINPGKYYTECKEAGLRPSFWDSCVNAIIPSQIQQRNYVLTILLENKVSSFLVRCVKEWADGSRGVSGCTLPNLIQWAWECITRIKQQTDIICVPLFDYSGDDLDRENYQRLKHCCCLMRIIRDLLNHISTNYKQYLLDESKLKHQINTLQLVTKYFDVIIWCLDCDLLPEKVTGSSDKCVPIYMTSISQYTEQRREELKIIASSDKYFLLQNSILYLIDIVLENEPQGRKLQSQWQREGGGFTTGLYPPLTLQSLLRMYLLPDLSTDVKNFIMMYFLLDVCDYHRDEDMKEQLLSFSVVFSIDPVFNALVQICWFIDHERFEEATNIFMIENVSPLLQNRPHLYKAMLQACVGQGQYSLALKFERFVNLATSVFDDERFYIMLLLQNGLVTEAYSTLKESYFHRKTLLQHFFNVCDDFGLLKEIFKFPLSREEEEQFMMYLDECKNKDAGDLKIMYLLSRARYVEAIDVNRNLGLMVPKFSIVGHDTTKQNAKTGRTTTRDLLVNAFAKTLPSVTNDLIKFCRSEKDKIYRFKEVAKPTPLSVVVHADISQPMPTYKSSFESVLQAAISKTAETWHKFPTISGNNKLNRSLLKDTPFLRSNLSRSRGGKPSLSNEGETTKADELETSDEPPRKRIKTNVATTPFEKAFAEIQEDSSSSPPLDVSNILRTPHVQKRFNKLMQNTPESSPLTSILKSSEISRFKQPQKVGFSVPEVSGRTPMKVSVAVEVHETPLNTNDLNKDTTARKSLAEKFESTEKTLNSDETSILQTEAMTSMNESLNKSANADSYYSLENDDDDDNAMCVNLVDFELQQMQKSPESVSVQHFVESMSEDEMVGNRNRLVMEVMSEEESLKEVKSYDSIRSHLSIEIPTKIENISYSIENNLPVPDIPNDFREGTIENEKDFILDTNEKRPVSQSWAESSNVFNVHNATYENPDFSLESYEKTTTEGDSMMADSGLPKIVSVSSTSNEQSSSEPYDLGKNITEVASLPVTTSVISVNETRFSLESYECVEMTVNRSEASLTASVIATGEELAPITEEDSDIEILDDEPTSSTKSESTDDQTSEENDRSEYSNSLSGSDEANIVDNVSTVVNDDDDRNAEELDDLDEQLEIDSEGLEEEEDEDIEEMLQYGKRDYVADEEEINVDSEEDHEVEIVADEEEKEIDVDDEEENDNESLEDEYEEEESEAEGDNDSNQDIEIESPEFDPNVIYRDNPNINYEELKNIMSTVAAVDTTLPYDDKNVSNIDQIAEPSIVEVYDADMSRPPMSFVDNNDSKTETSVEFLSVSAVVDRQPIQEGEANKSVDEPSMKFYFGENSVTSITDDMLGEDKIANSSKEENKLPDEPPKHVLLLEENDDIRVQPSTSCKSENARDYDRNTEVLLFAETSSFDSTLAPQPLKPEERPMDVDFSTPQNVGIDDAIITLQEEPLSAPDVQSEITESPIQQPVPESPQKSLISTECSKPPSVSQIVVSVELHESPLAKEILQTETVSPKKSSDSSFAGCVESVPAVELQTSPLLPPILTPPIGSSISQISTPPKKRLSPRINEAIAPLATQTIPLTRETTPTVSPSSHTPDISPSKEPSTNEISIKTLVTPPITTDTKNQDATAGTPTPRRSLRIRRYSIEPDFEYQLPIRRSNRRSVDRQLPDDASSDTVSAPPSRPSSRSSRRLSVDNDDAVSIKSGYSAAESVSSRASVVSTQSQSRKRLSFSRLEMRKSSIKPQLRKLEVIVSDEEESTSSTNKSKQDKSESAPISPICDGRRFVTSGISEEGSESKLSKGSEDEDRQSEVSETKSVTKKRLYRRSHESESSNKGSIVTPDPKQKRQKKLVSSTPVTKTQNVNTSSVDSETVSNYASSRRLTRSQKTLLQYGIQRIHNSDNKTVNESLTDDKRQLEDVPEEGSSLDSDNVFPEGSLRIEIDEEQTIVEAGSEPADDSIANRPTYASEPAETSVNETLSNKKLTKTRRRNRSSTYSSIELRKSSSRRKLKPLAVIPSDEESMAFQTPSRPRQVEDDSIVSSPESTLSKRSMPRRVTRSSRKESDVSDRESVGSDVSNVSSVTATKRDRRQMTDNCSSPESIRSKRQKATITKPRRQMTRRKN